MQTEGEFNCFDMLDFSKLLTVTDFSSGRNEQNEQKELTDTLIEPMTSSPDHQLMCHFLFLSVVVDEITLDVRIEESVPAQTGGKKLSATRFSLSINLLIIF